MFLPALQIGQVFLAFLGLPPYPVVQYTHDSHWHIERRYRCPKRNELVSLYELNIALVRRDFPLTVYVRPRVNPRRPQYQTEPPRTAYHHCGPACSPLGPVRQRSRHTEVPIETDDEQVEHGGVGREVVEREPRVAHMRAQRPVAVDGEHGVQRHGDQPHRKVRDRQREQKVVANGLQLLVDLEADHHHGVTDDGEHREDAGDDGDDDLLRETEGAAGEVGGLQVREVGRVVERDEHAVNWASCRPRRHPRPGSSADRARTRLHTQHTPVTIVAQHTNAIQTGITQNTYLHQAHSMRANKPSGTSTHNIFTITFCIK